MAVITLKIVVSNLTEVMVHFDKIKVYRSTTGETGVYTEITVPSTRPSLVSGTTIYEFVDESGAATYYYKSSYFHSVSSLESSKSEAQLGEGDAALDVISVDELKNHYLFGIDLTDDSGTPYPESLYETFIKSAVAWMEQKLDIPITPKSITEERHDYIREEYTKYMWMKLFEYPIIDVSEVKLVLPTEVVVKTFDSDWIHISRKTGQLQLIPGEGASTGVALIGVPGVWYPYLHGQRRLVPDAFRVTYTAGFESGTVPENIKDMIAKKACFGPLNIAGDLLGGAGIASQSVSIDGLSQSFNTTSSATNAGYGARLLQYSKEIKEDLPSLQKYWKGLKFTVA